MFKTSIICLPALCYCNGNKNNHDGKVPIFYKDTWGSRETIDNNLFCHGREQ